MPPDTPEWEAMVFLMDSSVSELDLQESLGDDSTLFFLASALRRLENDDRDHAITLLDKAVTTDVNPWIASFAEHCG